MDWMKIVGWLWLVMLVWCSWEFYNSPVMSDDYNEEGVNPDYTEIDDEE